jgi:aspartate/methionine/tyrosine aminotransferase
MKIPPFLLERYFAAHEFNVRYLLCASDCESVSLGELLALDPGAAERFARQRLGYTESSGGPGLRQAIAGLYASTGPEQVLVHSGAEEAIFLFMHAALRPGDRLVVQTPCYQSLAEVARSIGCAVETWPLREQEQGWAPDLQELRRLLRRRTRALVINSPHNPTGFQMSLAVFFEVIRLAEERGSLLFSDEVYREAEYREEDRLPAACDVSPSCVSLGVMSKSYGLAGLRIGWLATRNARLLEAVAALKDYTTICSPAPSEFLAELALRHRQRLLRRNLQLIRDNLQVLDAFFARHPERFSWRRPRAGPVAFPRLRGAEVGGFCDRLREGSGVLLLPGSVFGDRDNHFRIGFGRADLPRAVAHLEEALRR